MKYADAVADKGGWEWRRAEAFAEGDVQVFAGQRLIIQRIKRNGRETEMRYHDGRQRVWNNGTELGFDPVVSRMIVDD